MAWNLRICHTGSTTSRCLQLAVRPIKAGRIATLDLPMLLKGKLSDTRLWTRGRRHSPATSASQRKGVFIDVGAHHPVRFSDTWSLYQPGWRGINIDATPGSMKLFNALRPEDTNIEALISDTSGPVTFFSFEESALNTLDMRLAKSYIDANWPLKERIELVPQTLSALLDAHVPAGTHIDIMSIDVEEYELNVLKTNNWNVYKPTILIVEIPTASLRTLDAHSVVEYLQKHGYVPVAKLCRSVFLYRSSPCVA